MPFTDIYHRQVVLLVRILPFIAEEPVFALKGGTAINLFVRDMPRLSVDIDLTYLPVAARAESLTEIDTAMRRLAQRIRLALHGVHVGEAALPSEDVITKLVVRAEGVQVKIEVTPVLRGCVYEPSVRSISPVVEAHFGYAECLMVSFADLYGGKIVAALDRQHPRDLFDVRELFAREGLDDTLRCAFIVYLLSHGRPMCEVLAPTRRDISTEFARTFLGMTIEPITQEDLAATREALVSAVVDDMPYAHRRFLVSFERGEPEWPLLGIDGVANLPAIRWRQMNLDKLATPARGALVERLQEVLGL